MVGKERKKKKMPERTFFGGKYFVKLCKAVKVIRKKLPGGGCYMRSSRSRAIHL